MHVWYVCRMLGKLSLIVPISDDSATRSSCIWRIARDLTTVANKHTPMSEVKANSLHYHILRMQPPLFNWCWSWLWEKLWETALKGTGAQTSSILQEVHESPALALPLARRSPKSALDLKEKMGQWGVGTFVGGQSHRLSWHDILWGLPQEDALQLSRVIWRTLDDTGSAASSGMF